MAAGVRHVGGGLGGPEDVPEAVTDFLGPHHAESHHITVPDIRGLFFRECTLIVGRIGFHLSVVRLTEHPMPVDGLVVGQSPAPQAKAHRDSPLTIQVWHPRQAHPL